MLFGVDTNILLTVKEHDELLSCYLTQKGNEIRRQTLLFIMVVFGVLVRIT